MHIPLLFEQGKPINNRHIPLRKLFEKIQLKRNFEDLKKNYGKDNEVICLISIHAADHNL